MKNIRSYILSIFCLLFVVSANAVVIYQTDCVQNPTGATSTYNKAEFLTSAQSWASAYPNHFHTTGSAGALTYTFNPAIALSDYSNVQLKIYWGATSNRPLKVGINGGADTQVDAVATSAERSLVREATVNLSVSSLTSLHFISSGGGNVYIFRLVITGDGGGSTTPDPDPDPTPDPDPNPNPGENVVAVTGITLNKTATTLTVGQTETLTVTITPANATDKSVTWASTNTAVATVSNTGVVTALAEGTTTINVTSNDGNKVASCTVTVTAGQTPPVEPELPPTPPISTLNIHQPYTYEDPVAEGGYGATLTTYQNRTWEVYYAGRHKKNGSDRVLVVGTTYNPNGNDGTTKFTNANIITANETETACQAADGWFTVDYVETSNSSLSGKDMFIGGATQWKLLNNHYIELRVKGYDNFAIYADDNNADASKGKHIKVSVDGVEQNMTLSTSETVRYFNLSTAEHVIKVEGIGGSNNYFYGFALRPVSGARIKYIDGDAENQVINQTENLAPITYTIRNAASYNLTTTPTATGISLQAGEGDTVYVQGTANCPVGTYEYTITATSANGETTSQTGHFTVKTELVPLSATDVTVWINDPIPASALSFQYIALDADGITVNWNKPHPGILNVTNYTDHLVNIGGTPTKVGTYTYTISIAGGNTITGTITVEVPDPIFFEPRNKDIRVKNGQVMPNVEWIVKFANNVTAMGLPNGVTGNWDNQNNQFTIAGTPNVSVATYPAVYPYTLTATPLYEGQQTITATGTITILDPNALTVLYLTYEDYLTDNEALNRDGVYTYLNNEFELTTRPAEENVRPASQYNPYDVIVISEDANAVNEEVLTILRSIRRPVLNMQPFTYTTSRLGWGMPNYGSMTGKNIQCLQPSHPVFAGLGASVGQDIQVLSNVNGKGLMSVDVDLAGSMALASAPLQGAVYEEDGETAVFLHEVADSIRGAKYLLFPLAVNSSTNLTNNGKRLLKNAIEYLHSPASANIQLPELRIASFSINNYNAHIDEANSTIRLELPQGTDLQALTPNIQLVGSGTFVTPNSGEAVDFSDQHYGVTYIVSDLINTRTYTAYVSAPTDLSNTSLSGIHFEGKNMLNPDRQMLSIYNALGQLITTTNADFSFSALTTGIYLIIGTDAETLRYINY